MCDLFLFYIYTSVWQQTRTVLGCCAFLVPLARKLEKNFSLASQLNRLKMKLFTPVLQILRAFWTSSPPLWLHQLPLWGRHLSRLIFQLPNPEHVISFAAKVFFIVWKSEEGWRSGCLGRDASVPVRHPHGALSSDRARPRWSADGACVLVANCRVL